VENYDSDEIFGLIDDSGEDLNLFDMDVDLTDVILEKLHSGSNMVNLYDTIGSISDNKGWEYDYRDYDFSELDNEIVLSYEGIDFDAKKLANDVINRIESNRELFDKHADLLDDLDEMHRSYQSSPTGGYIEIPRENVINFGFDHHAVERGNEKIDISGHDLPFGKKYANKAAIDKAADTMTKSYEGFFYGK
tara:strand:- start:321 stop:896 length:576 start_codon:yes stop_codon:yes gene_type:complete